MGAGRARRQANDAREYALRARVLALDPLDQKVVYELGADKWVDGEHRASEEHTLTMRMYFPEELVLMLRNADFADVEIRGGYVGEEPTADHDFPVYIVSRSATPTSVQIAT